MDVSQESVIVSAFPTLPDSSPIILVPVNWSGEVFIVALEHLVSCSLPQLAPASLVGSSSLRNELNISQSPLKGNA